MRIYQIYSWHKKNFKREVARLVRPVMEKQNIFTGLGWLVIMALLLQPLFFNTTQAAIKGSITVCKVIADTNGNILDGSTNQGTTFSVSGFDPQLGPGWEPAGILPTSNFTSPLTFNTDLFFSDGILDAECVTPYSNLPLGLYFYNQEVITGSGWNTPLYNDQHTLSVTTLADFFPYDANLFDGNPNNDDQRNTNSDGAIKLTTPSAGRHRTLVVLNQLPAVSSDGFLVVTKQVINDNGGSLQIGDFPLFVDATPVTSGQTETLIAGIYTISETNQPGYAATFSGDCSSNGQVTVVAGQTKTCTITNNDIQPKLTVVKQVVNDNGGSLQVGDFPLFVNSTPVTSGTQNGFNVGSYTVSETSQSGYTATISGDCDQNGNVSLTLGDDKTCTITNNDQQAELTVIKQVVNDNGGTAVPADFTMQVTGTNVSNSSFTGSASGTTITLDAGSYSVSELGPTGYSQSASANCLGTLAPGASKTCTITNDDISPKLTVTKVVVNNDGGSATVGDFSLFVDATQVTSGAQNNFNTGSYTVSESGSAGYTATFSGDCDSQGNLTLNLGDVKSCTITNDDNPAPPPSTATLIVIKQVVNDNGGTAVPANFTMQVTGTNVSLNSFPGSASGTTITLGAGVYSVGETGPAGYSDSGSADCFGTIQAGQTKTCTITNNDIQPKLTVVKQVVNDNGGSLQVGDFPLFVNSTPVTSGTQNGFNVGSYTVSETSQSGYTATISGDCDQNGNVSLTLGDDKTCTITNNDIQPTLTVTKVVVNDDGTGTALVADFTLLVDATPVPSGVATGFNAGSYTVSESGPAGYTATISGDCGPSGNITLNLGDVKSCVITNDDLPPPPPTHGSLTVTKQVVNDDGGSLQIGDFPLFIDTTLITSSQQSLLTPGTYTVSETNQAGYATTFSGDCNSSGQVTIVAGQTYTCTITNNDIQPTLLVTKVVVNDDATGSAQVSDFSLFVDATSVTSGVSQDFNAGSYVVSETGPTTGYLSTFSGDCDASGNISLALADNKSCTITNNDIPAADGVLTVTKVVVNDDGGMSQVTDFTLSVDTTTVVSGVGNSFLAGSYTISEIGPVGYSATFSGDCDSAGSITIVAGQSYSCTITNDDVPHADLSVVKSVNDDTPDQGQKITYTITVTNNGPASATNVQVTDQLPADVTFDSAIASQGIYDNSTGVWNVGSLTNGVSVTLDLLVTINSGTGGASISNSAVVTATEFDPNGNNDASSQDLTVNNPVVITGGGGGGGISSLYIHYEQINSSTDTSVTLTWFTNLQATSRVVFDTISAVLDLTPNFGYSSTTPEDPALTTFHTLTVSGLTPDTTYFLRPVSFKSPNSEVYGDELTVSTTSGGEVLGEQTEEPTSGPPTEPPTPPATDSIGTPPADTGEVAGEQIEEPPVVEELVVPEEPQDEVVTSVGDDTTTDETPGPTMPVNCTPWIWLLLIANVVVAAVLWDKQKNNKSALIKYLWLIGLILSVVPALIWYSVCGLWIWQLVLLVLMIGALLLLKTNGNSQSTPTS